MKIVSSSNNAKQQGIFFCVLLFHGFMVFNYTDIADGLQYLLYRLGLHKNRQNFELDPLFIQEIFKQIQGASQVIFKYPILHSNTFRKSVCLTILEKTGAGKSRRSV